MEADRTDSVVDDKEVSNRKRWKRRARIRGAAIILSKITKRRGVNRKQTTPKDTDDPRQGRFSSSWEKMQSSR